MKLGRFFFYKGGPDFLFLFAMLISFSSFFCEKKIKEENCEMQSSEIWNWKYADNRHVLFCQFKHAV